jgi:selT/selW/selH-like putative selenoprotein
VFEEFSNLVRQRYPAVLIEGDHFPPPPFKAIAAQVLSFVKIGLLLCIVIGYNPFNMFGVATPSIYTWAITNKIYACMMLFFIGNAIEGQLISTGAFEVFFNDVPVWSKLEVGRIPSPQELFQILDSQFRLSSTSHSSNTL